MSSRKHDPERLRALLLRPTAKSGRHTYAVLDAARDPSIFGMLGAHAPVKTCLYKGDLAPELAAAAPWLVQLEPEGLFTDWLLETAWGKAFGIYVESIAPLESVARHLRGFLRVKGPDGENLLFRYYDPRVARVYLPTMNEEEARVVCGSLLRLVVESEDATVATEWTPVSGALPKRVEHDLSPSAARLAG